MKLTGDIHKVPISHGEGRFVAPERLIKELNRKWTNSYTIC